MIRNNIGRNLHHLRVFTESLINSKETEPDFVEHLKCKGPEWNFEYNKFVNKIQSIYLRDEVQHLVENNTLDFAILSTLENFSKNIGEIQVQDQIGEEIKNQSIIRAFTETGLLYAEKHDDYLLVPSMIWVKFFKKYVTQKKSEMSLIEKIEYNYWKIYNHYKINDLKTNIYRENVKKMQDQKANRD